MVSLHKINMLVCFAALQILDSVDGRVARVNFDALGSVNVWRTEQNLIGAIRSNGKIIC